MIAKKCLIILLSLSLLSCTQKISNPTDADFSGTEIYGDWVNLQLNDGTFAKIKVDFHNSKGIYGSGKGYDWENIQKITIEKKNESRGSAENTESSTTGDIVNGIFMAPVFAVKVAGVFVVGIWYMILCSFRECTK